MTRDSIKRVQDSVHGLMEFRDNETMVLEVLSTPELQRLRRIRQMGMAHMVFPGAEHSRLVHVLGASHIALLFGKRLVEVSQAGYSLLLQPDPEAIRDLAVAALCHDIGHGPLSHAWEREVIGGADYDFAAWCNSLKIDPNYMPAGQPNPPWHELVGRAMILDPEGSIREILDRHASGFAERIASMLSGSHYIPYFPPLISSDIDIDRADYLLRDSHNCGVKYGEYDLTWLLSTLAIGHTDSGRLVVGFDSVKAPKVVEQFLIARSAMYESVYHHKTIHSIEGMVGTLLRRLRSLEMERLAKLEDAGDMFRSYVRALSGNPIAVNEVLDLDDFGLWTMIQYLARHDAGTIDPTAHDLAGRICNRDLFHMVPVESERLVDFLMPGNGGGELIDDVVSARCAGDPSFYWFVDKPEFAAMKVDDNDCSFLVFPDGRAVPLAQSGLFDSIPTGKKVERRLFTTREALPEVTRLVNRE